MDTTTDSAGGQAEAPVAPAAPEAEAEAVPLLDAEPVLEGKRNSRARKKVERFDYAERPEPASKAVQIPEGTGTELGEIEKVREELAKHKASAPEVQELARLCFGRACKGTTRKKLIRAFRGYSPDEAESTMERRRTSLKSRHGNIVKGVRRILCVQSGSTRAEMVDAILAFLKAPSAAGAALHRAPTKKRKRAAGAPAKKKRAKTKPKKTGGPSKAELAREAFQLYVLTNNADVQAESPAQKVLLLRKQWDDLGASKQKPFLDQVTAAHKKEEEEEEEEESDIEESEEEEEEAEESAPVEKKKAPKLPSATMIDGSSSEEETLSGMPTDSALVKAVRDVLALVDVAQATSKSVRALVAKRFPNIDLSSKKEFLKQTIRDEFSS